MCALYNIIFFFTIRMTFPPKLDLTTLINTTKYGEYEKKQSMKEQNINNNNNNNNNVQENGGDYIYNICGSEMDFANLCNGFIPSLNDTTGSKSIGVKLSDEKSDKGINKFLSAYFCNNLITIIIYINNTTKIL